MRIPIKSGAVIPLLIMLPNIAWFLIPNAPAGDAAAVPLFLNIVENAGRVAIIVIPFFYAINLRRRYSTPALVICSLALALYYAAWIRYFAAADPALLGSAFLGIPMPLAVAPVVLLIASSYLLGSWPMLATSVWFGIAHIWVTALTY